MSGCIFPDCKGTCLPTEECLHDIHNRITQRDKTITRLLNENRSYQAQMTKLITKVNKLQNQLNAAKSSNVVKRPKGV